MGLPNAEMDG